MPDLKSAGSALRSSWQETKSTPVGLVIHVNWPPIAKLPSGGTIASNSISELLVEFLKSFEVPLNSFSSCAIVTF